MPIVFQAPEPVAPEVASAYGAAEIGQRNNSVLASMYGQAADTSLRARLGTAQLQFQGAEAASREQTARGINRANLAEQGREFDQTRLDRQAAQQYAQQHDAAMAEQRTQLTAWLNDQELSQKEEQRLSTMKNSVADVQGDDNLAPEEKVAAITKLRTGIDVYEMRQRKALATQEEAHAAAYQKQADVVAKSEIEVAKAQKDAADRGETTRVYRDPHTGIAELHYWSQKKGEWYNPSVNHGATGTGPARLEKPVAGTTTAGEFDWSYHNKQAENEAMAAFPVRKVPGPEGKGTVDENAAGRADYFQKVVNRRQEQWRAANGQPPGQADRGPGSADEPLKKLDATIEEAKARTDLLPGVRQQLVGSMESLKRIVAAYPDVRTAPPQVQAEAQAAARVIAAAPPPSKRTEGNGGMGGNRRIVANTIDLYPPPPQPYEKSWWQRNVVDNIPDVPGV